MHEHLLRRAYTLYMGRMGRDWLKELFSVQDSWTDRSHESSTYEDPIFCVGDMLHSPSGGSGAALIVMIKHHMWDWQYDVLFDGGMHTVSEGALHGWVASL
jgi:hypothetical protein